MSLLWIMAGLALAAFLFLLFGFWFYRKGNRERKRHEAQLTVEKNEIFQQNCAHYHLSDREIQIVSLITNGHTYRSTGEQLFISEKTVDAHVQNAYRKVGARNKLELYHKLYYPNTSI